MGLYYYTSKLFLPVIPVLECMRGLYFLFNNLSSIKILRMLLFIKISYYYVGTSYRILKFVELYYVTYISYFT
jgi:hypothetical protein